MLKATQFTAIPQTFDKTYQGDLRSISFAKFKMNLKNKKNVPSKIERGRIFGKVGTLLCPRHMDASLLFVVSGME